MRKKICAVIAILSFLRLLGIAGSSDLGMIDLSQILSQTTLAVILFAGSIYVGGFTK